MIADTIAGIFSPFLKWVKDFLFSMSPSYGDVLLFGLAVLLSYLFYRYLARNQNRSKWTVIFLVSLIIYIALVLA